MARRVKWTGWHATGSPTSELRAGDRGRGDTGPTYCDTKPGYFFSLTDVAGAGRKKGIRLAQWAGERCRVGWELLDDQGDRDELATYSMSFEFSLEAKNFGATYRLLTFRNGGQDGDPVWSLAIRKWNIFDFATQYGRVFICDAAGNAYGGYSTWNGSPYRMSEYNLRRIELSVVDGTITVDGFYDYGGDPGHRFTLTTDQITDVDTVDTVEVGVTSDTNNLSALPVYPPTYVQNIRLYDTDETPIGQYTDVDRWRLWNGTSFTELDPPQLWDGSEFVDLRSFRGKTPPFTDVVRGPHTRYLNVATGRGFCNLYIPTGDPPPGGWPVVCWGFSGFFVGGSKEAIIGRWVRDLCANGIAVQAIGYIPASDVYDIRHPALLIDYKMQARWLMDNAATYGVNPDRFYASGYSAGGYLALMAALTTGVTDDGAGRDLTGSTPDPVFAGACVYAAPVDLEVAVDEDPIDPVVELGIRTFLDKTGGGAIPYDGTRLQDWITPSSPPVGYVRGRQDDLITASHPDLLAQAYTDAGIPERFTRFDVAADHDSIDENFDASPFPDLGGSQQIVDWIATVEAA